MKTIWTLFIIGLCTAAHAQRPFSEYRAKDDLAGWIYAQLPWVAQQPGARSGQLVWAVSAAWRSPRNNNEIQAWQDLLVNEGYALLMAGDIVHSTDAYTAAFQWARAHQDLEDPALVLDNILKPLGNNYTRLGDYEQALFIHRKALVIAQALGNKDAIAGTCSNLANAESNRGDPEQALIYCRQGLGLTGIPGPVRGLLLSEEADALQALGQTSEARRVIRKSIGLLGGAPGWLFTAYQQAGDIFLEDPDQALAFYNHALVLQTGRRETAKLYQRLGNLYYQTHRYTEASAWLDKCQSLLIPGGTNLYAENTLVDLFYTRARVYEAEDSTDRALRCYGLSFAAEGKLRSELISGPSKERAVADSRMRQEAAIQCAWAAWVKTQKPLYRQMVLDFMESSKAQLLLQEQREQAAPVGEDSIYNRIRLLERALAYYEEEAAQTGHALDARYQQSSWDLAGLRKRVGINTPARYDGGAPFVPEGTDFVRSFFAGGSALYLVECDHKGIRFADRLNLSNGWQDSIRGFLQTYFEQGPNAMINRPRDYYGRAYAIYQRLFGAHPLETGKRYIFLPDGALSLLPVEALVTEPRYSPSPGDWPFVLQKAAVSYAWSLQTLRRQTVSPGNARGFAGFFISENNRNLPALQAVAAEREVIARVIPGGRFFSDSSATVAAFRNALSLAAVIHVSVHATVGNAPCIQLYDRPFYLFQLSALETHPSLVVLSACRTGDGRMVSGEGAQSLARAFTAAGTGAVVAGWWNVDDETAAALMPAFYRSVVAGDAPVWALRKAQLSWVDDPGVAYLHKLPYYWAALHYQGDPGAVLRMGHAWGKYVWWVMGIVIVLILLLKKLLTLWNTDSSADPA